MGLLVYSFTSKRVSALKERSVGRAVGMLKERSAGMLKER